ncbi:MAG: hypothetical protein R6U99_05540 [Nioella sp.]
MQRYPDLRPRNLSIASAAVVIGAVVDWRLGLVLAVWLAAWGLNIVLSGTARAAKRFVVPAIFGITLLVLWQIRGSRQKP